ncbi:dihydroorotase [Marivibrio halodurans]|uniref:Dihydroorotase n=1 Tax=Marivibrio halodurans TaxID=2039722 RepID=A0A8J7SI72_9PROT|nr:dihydroorotase [Marivibrio halodurans]MBP5856898.1 dihydroorotase [Marivibrio halodurans]
MNQEGRTAYLNARLLDPASGLDETGALLVEDGRIADFGAHLFRTGAPSVNEVIDCKGLCLAPGLIDIRVQLREPGEEHKETIETGTNAAAAGGVSSMVCLPNTTPPVDDVSVLEFIARRSRELKRSKIFSYGALTKGLAGEEITEIGLLREAGALAFTDGERALADAKIMKRALSYARTFDALIVQHPLEPSLSRGGVMNQGELATRLGLSGVPTVAETIQVERDLRLLESNGGGRLHFAHVTAPAALEAIRRAKAQGLDVTCDTAPHYFALNENAVGDYRSFAKVMPPLRSEADRQALVEAIADGTVDIIASDHSPHDQDSKRLPYEQAAFGVIGLQTLLPMTLELYHNGHVSLLEALSRLTDRPAARFGIPGGRLRRGAAADLVLFDPDKPWTISEEAMVSKSKNTAFGDRPVQGRVVRTVVDGRPLYVAPARR